jgi:Ohr subfamily peroxiredoxin
MTTATALNTHAPAAKTLFTGRTHTSAGRDGHGRSEDGFVDVKLSAPHPAAENLFGVAWSACYLGAIELAAAQHKVKLAGAPSADAEINLNKAGEAYFLSASFKVTLPGVDRATAEKIAEAAHAICPYSKAVHGNISVSTSVI